MKSFPLIRSKWSNEYILTAFFATLVLYLIPEWLKEPGGILTFLALVTIGLVIDTVLNFIRHRSPVCAVSAGVTVGILYILTPGVPFWGKLVGIIAALIIGKHIWGGTGMNPVNPAIIGLIVVSLLFEIQFPLFRPTLLLLPAILLSLLFIPFRPYAAIGFMVGMVNWISLSQGVTLTNFLSYGVIFWGCLIITDPVTMTPHPLIGGLGGFIVGFIPYFFDTSLLPLTGGIVVLNIVSYLIEYLGVNEFSNSRTKTKVKVKEFASFNLSQISLCDLTNRVDRQPDVKREDISKELVLKRIENNQVFGMGGGAFPTYQKIKVVDKSKATKKYLLLNGVECDPGLIHDKWLIHKYSREICQGIDALRQSIDFEEVILAVKEDKGLDYPDDIKVYKVPDFYPIGEEKILIKEVLGRDISHETIPAQEGILVINAQTILSIYQAVFINQKADTRFLTLADTRKGERQVVRVPLGIGISNIIDKIYPDVIQYFYGGGLMQAKIGDDEKVVDQTVNFIAVGDFPNYKESPACSKCGLCVTNCPVGLNVYKIAEMVDNQETAKLKKESVEKCIQCGSCSFLCLAGRNLSSRLLQAQASVQ